MNDFLLSGVPLFWPVKALTLAVLAAFVFRKVGKGADGARSAGFVAVASASFIFHGLPGLAMGIGWSLTRSQPFKDGAATPTKLKHFLRALIRMIWPAIAAAVCYFVFGKTLAPLGALVGVTGYLGLAAWYGDLNDDAKDSGKTLDPKWNVIVERGQGFVAAAAYSITLTWSAPLAWTLAR